jgi:hypothetical protein
MAETRSTRGDIKRESSMEETAWSNVVIRASGPSGNELKPRGLDW